ncbi:hypothetical protein Ccrd_004055 [Cynara cardunculus var. scolymus]|uniref:Uncharacterized protein n=1 Tax=Cynara cardunculus var. scolymus TaxID=59895 RepID=A0A118JVW5_CYNCS|nr:hypothetical protein Ccrd_004055 [Cynara cardunculus var. scolymus]
MKKVPKRVNPTRVSSPSNIPNTAVAANVVALVTGTAREIGVSLRIEKKAAEADRLTRKGTEYCQTKRRLNQSMRVLTTGLLWNLLITYKRTSTHEGICGAPYEANGHHLLDISASHSAELGFCALMVAERSGKWYVDSLLIRLVKNYENEGTTYPNQQGMLSLLEFMEC